METRVATHCLELYQQLALDSPLVQPDLDQRLLVLVWTPPLEILEDLRSLVHK